MAYQQLVEQHHAQTYGNNVVMVAQQKKDKLRGAVTELPCTGEAHSVADLIGDVEAQRRSGRDNKNPENPPKNTRRWLVMPDDVHSGQTIQKEEKFKQLYDPTSKLVTVHTTAVRRGVQDIILGVQKSGGKWVVSGGGILGRATEGKNPGNSKALPDSSVIAHGGTGMNTDKLIEAQEALLEADFGIDDDEDANELFCAIGPRQVTNLLKVADAASESLNAFEIEQLKRGRPTPLMGITWIVTNRLPKSDAGVRSCPVWAKSNIALGIWQDIEGRMWNLTEQLNLPYAYVSAIVDCVRIEDAGVRVIQCQE